MSNLNAVVGTVIRSHAGGYLVHLPQEDEVDFVLFCQARGRLKKEKVAILTGDRVELSELNYPERTAVIVQHQERKTFIDRPPLANIDQVVIVQAVRQPDFNPLWMDRYLVHFQLSVPFTTPIICLNKCDLEDESGLLRLRSIYEPLGYFVIFASATTGVGLEELARCLAGKVSMFSGPSGVGKSSLLNRLSPGLDIKVGRMENSFGVGRHTTTYSELYRLNLDSYLPPAAAVDAAGAKGDQSLEVAQERQFSWVADTPGFNVMEFMQSDPREVARQFPEICDLGQYCKFADCLHLVEAGCAVLASLEGEMPELEAAEGEDTVEFMPLVESRYVSYCTMVAEAQEMEAAAKTVSSKKESNVKTVGSDNKAKAKVIPRLAGKYRAAARNTEKQRIPRVEDFDDVGEAET
ncbi:MAG: ribosome small subunit-dependent GTPase A [Cyanobacteria bacterium SZAS LIN-3]|nr:ribosome small subunit-dependent GTPase A [Cyanobacteria bacterium SZAS LIN-3]